MNTLTITVVHKMATYHQRCGDIICGNSDYQIEFLFDEDWAEHDKKTARFIWNGQYHDVDFSGNVCPVPIITGADLLWVGVYAGDLQTTTSATIKCKRSILCREAIQRPESAEQYVNEARAAAEQAKSVAENYIVKVKDGVLYANIATVQGTKLYCN